MASEKSRTAHEEVRTRVLVLDDEPLIRWAASTTLTAAGYDVIEASDVGGARQRVVEAPIGLALLDLRLSDGDGLALMHEIQHAQPDCRFILMTAFRTPELSGYAAGGEVAVLDKPFGMHDLVKVVAAVLKPIAA